MEVETGLFEAFYASPIQHPILLWLASGVALLFSLTTRGLPIAVRRYCVLLVVLSTLDAWLSSSHIYGIGRLDGAAASRVPLFFVLAGDFRYLFLVLAGTPRGGIEFGANTLAGAVGLTLVVPILNQLIMAALPASLDSARVMFLIYEVSFVCLTLSLLRWHPNLRKNRWMVSVSRFVVVYYALWASADIVILSSQSDLGYLLRVVPNVLYYGGLIVAIGWWVPRNSQNDRVPAMNRLRSR